MCQYNSSDPSNNLIGTATYHVINGTAEVESDEEWTEKAVVTMYPRSKIYLDRFHLQDGLVGIPLDKIYSNVVVCLLHIFQIPIRNSFKTLNRLLYYSLHFSDPPGISLKIVLSSSQFLTMKFLLTYKPLE